MSNDWDEEDWIKIMRMSNDVFNLLCSTLRAHISKEDTTFRKCIPAEIKIAVTFRSSHPEVFLVKGVLKICSKFTGEHPCRSVISIKLFCKHTKTSFSIHFLQNSSRWLLSDDEEESIECKVKRISNSEW